MTNKEHTESSNYSYICASGFCCVQIMNSQKLTHNYFMTIVVIRACLCKNARYYVILLRAFLRRPARSKL